jgi:hypothetical protein
MIECGGVLRAEQKSLLADGSVTKLGEGSGSNFLDH